MYFVALCFFFETNRIKPAANMGFGYRGQLGLFIGKTSPQLHVESARFFYFWLSELLWKYGTKKIYKMSIRSYCNKFNKKSIILLNSLTIHQNQTAHKIHSQHSNVQMIGYRFKVLAVPQ